MAGKQVDLSVMRIVHCGDEWEHTLPPSCKEMTHILERNERIVSWLQPVSGCVDDQIPVWRSNGSFYRMSLRMMKCIWRHVRLRKGFVNRELSMFGGEKLKIPRVLLMEKLRTQHRFNVMRMDSGKSVDRRPPQCASHKIHNIVTRVLFPLAEADVGSCVSFRKEPATTCHDLVQFLLRCEPALGRDKELFLRRVGEAYDSITIMQLC